MPHCTRGDDSHRLGGCGSDGCPRPSGALGASRPRNDHDVGVERIGHGHDSSELRVRRRREQASDACRVLPDLPRQLGLREATRRISEDNLHDRLALSGPNDELKALADTIDGLLERLEMAFDAQRRFVANAS
jgi:hypothetical protein